MKVRVEKTGTAGKIIDDQELTLEIERLITISMEKGYKKTQIMNTISQKWHEMTPIEEKEVIGISEDEAAFFEKVSRFYQDLGQAFIARIIWCNNGMDWKRAESEKKDEAYEQRLLESLIASTRSMYYIFCRKDTITKKEIEDNNKELFNKKIGFVNTYALECALTDISLVDGKPTYIPYDQPHKTENYIVNNESFIEFERRFDYRNTSINRVAIELIWLISTYY